MKQTICPYCGEKENFHFNYDYAQKHMPVINVLCNECGEFFDQYDSWDDIEEEYQKDEYPVFGGPFTNALTPFEWLKKNYHTPKRK